MKYNLYEGNAKSGPAVISGDFEDSFAAERWAKEWVQSNAKGDTYTLESDGGGPAMTVFRTQAGQWYLTPKLAGQAA